MYQFGEELHEVLKECREIVGLESHNDNILMEFAKQEITFTIQNAAATFQKTLKVPGEAEVKRAVVSFKNLDAYVKGRSSIKFNPKKDGFHILSKNFKAMLYYQPDFEADIPDLNEMSPVGDLSEFVMEAYGRISKMKDRLEGKQPLVNIFSTQFGNHISVGDNHHVVLIYDKTEDDSRENIDVNMTLPNVERVFSKATEISVEPFKITAVSDTTFLSILTTALGDTIHCSAVIGLSKGFKHQGYFVAEEMLKVLTTATVGSTPATSVELSYQQNAINVMTKTGSGHITEAVAAELKADPPTLSYNVHQMLDCIRAFRGKVYFKVSNEMIQFAQVYGKPKTYVFGMVATMVVK